MVIDLSVGDLLRFGDNTKLTVLAVEDDLVRFGLESPEGLWVQEMCGGADLKLNRGDELN